MNYGQPSKEQLVIAIDYDDTFTADVDMWGYVIKIFQNSGHRVICVSARQENYGNRHELETALPDRVDVFLSYGDPKSLFVESRGINVDIWIDDFPASIPTKQQCLSQCG
jgi:hypothetical protein